MRFETSFSNPKEDSKFINVFDESIPFEKSDICYNFMKNKELHEENNNKLLTSSVKVADSTDSFIERQTSIKVPEPKSGSNEKNKLLDRSNSSISTPHNTTVSQIHQINGTNLHLLDK